MSNLPYAMKKVSDALTDVATLVGQQSNQLVTLNNGTQMIPGLGLESLAHDLQNRANDLSDGIFKVVALGEFKTGKSTLLNALVGQDLLPARATPATAVISVLHYGENGSVEVVEQGAVRKITLAEFHKSYQLATEDARDTGAYQRFQQIDYVRIACPYGLLRDGVQLVDAPGLGEHTSRTKLTMGVLRQAQAILFILRASSLSRQSIAEIDTFSSEGYQPHVFFVINRVDQVDSHDEVWKLARVLLRPYFCDAAGTFDEKLFEQRVFLTNARAALKLRLSDTPKQSALDSSGVPALEAALLDTLSSEGRVEAAEAASFHVLRQALYEAYRMIGVQEAALEHPLDRDEQRQQKVVERLESLRRRIERLRRDLERHNQAIGDRLYSDLVQFVSQMEATWSHDARDLISLDEKVLRNIIGISLTGSKRVDIERKIDEQIHKYLSTKLADWGRRVPALLEPEIDAMIRTVERHSRVFSIKLSRLQESISGAPASGFATEWSQRVMSKVSLKELRPGITNRNAINSKNSLGSTIDNIAIAMLMTGLTGNALLGVVVIGVLEGMRHIRSLDKLTSKLNLGEPSRKAEDLLIQRIGEELFRGLRNELSERRQELYRNFDDALVQGSNQIIEMFQARITEVQQQIDTLRMQQSAGEATINQERQRLTRIGEQLLAISNQFAASTNNPPIDRATLDEELAAAAAASRTELDDQDDAELDHDLDEELDSLEEETQTTRTAMVNTMTTRLSEFVNEAVRPADDASIQRLLKGFDRLTGLKSVKDRLLDLAFFQAERKQRIDAGMVDSKEPPTLHMVFTGNPGTGKTSVAELLAPVYHDLGLLPQNKFTEAKITDLISRYLGGSAHEVQQVFKAGIGGVLFIDEAYQLAETHIYGQESINLLNDLMEKHRSEIVIIVAGYTDKMKLFFEYNPGLAARFPKSNYIEFPDYEPPELMEILEHRLSDEGYEIDPAARLALLNVVENMYAVREHDFGNAREMRNLAQDLIMHRAHRRQSRVKNIPIDEPITEEDIPEKYAAFVRQAVFRPEAILDELDQELVGLAPVKTMIKELVMQLKYERDYSHQDAPRSLLNMVFTGNPGTGKTTVARMIGRIFRSLGYLRKGHVVELKYYDFVTPYTGGTAQRTIEQMHQALDGVLFIDEAYTLQKDGRGREVIETLLVEMENQRDRLAVILAGYPDEMETLLDTNPGLRSRIGRRIHFPDYNADELRQLLQRQASAHSLRCSDRALARAQQWLLAEQKHSPDTFGNGRSVRSLFEKMKARLAVRIMRMEEGAERDRVAQIIEPEDLPPLDLVYTVTTEGQRRRISEDQRLNLELDVPDAAADQTR